MGLGGHQNLVRVLLARAAEHPDKPLLRFHRDGAWRDWTYRQVIDRAKAIAGGLAGHGVVPGDRCAILSENRPEWALADFGSLCTGAVVVTVYPSLPAEDAAYILSHSEAKVLFAENPAQAARILAICDHVPALERIVLLEGRPEDAGLATDQATQTSPAEGRPAARTPSSRPVIEALEALELGSDPEIARQRVHEAQGLPSDAVFSILYTSGTTGVPKGVVLTHGNAVRTLEAVLETTPDTRPYDLNLSFLPLAHALERFGGELTPLFMGRTIAYARSLQAMPEDLLAVRPSFLIVVPRVLEKIHAKFQARLAQEHPLKRRMVAWCLDIGRQVSMRRERGRRLGAVLGLQYAVADRLVFSRIRRRLGGRIKLIACGSAPLSVEIARFFHSAGISICEGWGATETSAPVTINTPDHYRLGSVGKPLPHLEVKLDDDGELLVRGPGVFLEYYKDSETTRQSFTADGFFRTGDIGRVDADGYYYIVDRKKDLIITSGGKNVAPQKLEAMLRDRPLISNAMVHGDRRPCLVALVTVDREALAAAAPALALAGPDDPALMARIAGEVQAVNAVLPRFEQIKAFRVVEPDFSHETGELTLTLKLRRRVIESRYQSVLDGLYDAKLLEGANP